ncbi:MAG: hypothetical protein COB36_04980 [Alphaproteobacteria bacterium]|nr:MAG: hypothetical protein COB36_04980 [Alphaproteobacteria bacterium]
MSKEYAESKIREALKAHGDNIGLARQHIVSMAQADAALMRALAQPHLDGIVAYQVERVASGRAEMEKRHPKEPAQNKIDNFGMELLRAVAASDAETFGQEGMGAKRKMASKQHIDAIHQMASKAQFFKPSDKK